MNTLNINKNLSLAVVIAALSLGTSVSSASASIVSDGDFSDASGTGSFITYGTGQSFGGWTVTDGSVDVIDHNYWQSPGPNRNSGSVDMNGYNAGTLSQNLNIGAGQYLLTFSLSVNANVPLTQQLGVHVGDASQSYTFTPDSFFTRNNMEYITESLAFTVPTNHLGPIGLTFASLSPENGYGGPVIGNVAVSAVPLPASVQMFGLGLLGLVGFAYYNRRKNGLNGLA